MWIFFSYDIRRTPVELAIFSFHGSIRGTGTPVEIFAGSAIDSIRGTGTPVEIAAFSVIDRGRIYGKLWCSTIVFLSSCSVS